MKKEERQSPYIYWNKMSEVETPHDSQTERDTEEEVMFREDDPHVENSTPNVITANDLDVVIEGWERKFEHLKQRLREMQLDSEKANSTMSNIVRDGPRARGYAGAPYRGDACRTDAVPGEMRPRAPHSMAQC